MLYNLGASSNKKLEFQNCIIAVMADRLYKLQSKHTSNSGSTKPLSRAQAIFYSLPNNEWGTKYCGLTYSA